MKATQSLLQDAVDRRGFLRVVGMAGGTLVLVSCGVGSSNSGSGELTFWLPGGSPNYCAAHNTIEKNYEKIHPNVHMKPVLCGTGQQDFSEVLLARIAAGNPPDATISWDTPVSYGVRGAVEPLDTLMKASKYARADQWPSGVLASCQFNGKTYGLPITAGTYGMWYNQDLFEQKGISSKREDFPKTWDEMRRLSKELVGWKGDRLQTAGFIPPHIITNDQYVLPIWSALNGSQLYDAANHKYTLDAEANIAMMEFFLSWLDEQYKGDINKVLRSGTWRAYPDSKTNTPPAFQQGRLGMLVEGSWLTGDLYSSIPLQFKNWNVAPLPVGPGGSKTVSGHWPNWAIIPRGAPHKEEIFQYLDYMCVKGIAPWYNVAPDLPANKGVSRDLLPSLVVQKRGKAFAQDITDFFRRQQEIVTSMWDSPIQSFADDTIAQALDRMVRKVATPKQALSEAQKTCQSELESTLRGVKS